ncbi:MAG: hypothetical protein Q7R47_04505 [Candidatus Diapherotrites archaeon]|nr:hypothetical protein [Candidatus Diapherotrites archaeon]
MARLRIAQKIRTGLANTRQAIAKKRKAITRWRATRALQKAQRLETDSQLLKERANAGSPGSIAKSERKINFRGILLARALAKDDKAKRKKALAQRLSEKLK